MSDHQAWDGQEMVTRTALDITDDTVREALARVLAAARAHARQANYAVSAVGEAAYREDEATLTAALADYERVKANATRWKDEATRCAIRAEAAEDGLSDPAYIRMPRAVLERHAASEFVEFSNAARLYLREYGGDK